MEGPGAAGADGEGAKGGRRGKVAEVRVGFWRNGCLKMGGRDGDEERALMSLTVRTGTEAAGLAGERCSRRRALSLSTEPNGRCVMFR